MAKMFPDTDHTRVIFASRAEESFYDACRKSLNDAWTVYYSRTLSTIDRNSGLTDNEIDFVLYHRAYGVVVIEVKGGRIRHGKNGKFYSINRYDESFEIKDPFQQALVWKSRFWRVLRNRNIKLPVSHAVAFPSVHESEFVESASIVPEIIIGRQKMASLAGALKNIVNQEHPEQYLKFDDVAEDLHGILWGKDFTSKLFLKDYLSSHDLRVKDIEVIQETLVQPISASNRLAVEGEAGTGKTLIALLLARQFRSQGKRVLMLSSNPLLNEYLKSEAGADVEVSTYIELGERFGVHLLKAPSDYEGERDDWSQYEAPDRLIKAISASSTRYDVLICDEAQDVQPFWWEALEAVLKSEDSHFLVFFDRSQGIFGAGSADRGFVPEQVLPISPPYYPLVYNYRTTREIAGFARSFRTGTQVMQSHCGRLGYIPELVVYDDAQDCRGKLGRLFRKLFREEEVATDDVTVLSARNPKTPESVLKPTDQVARYGFRLLSSDQSSEKKANDKKGAAKSTAKINLSTISGFKGLETPIAVLLNLSEYNLPLDNPIMSSLVYVACTRAKHMLYIMVQKDDPKRAAFETAIKAIKNTGSLVLEGSDANFEFVGSVSHYNPDRIGWLTVNDPAFEKSTIMFFPHDVAAAGLNGIKKGDSLRFRPRVEGHATIATDLKPVAMQTHSSEASEPETPIQENPVTDAESRSNQHKSEPFDIEKAQGL
ncbi:MAG: NERD domain-containing protein [Gammaproteobacteria bacterium]|nr:NERD domain-containing protein [Gammaproteobacteria bacterium]MDH5802571.1 NERD domain-containing protein [Gammaproteobacteria bacterium]